MSRRTDRTDLELVQDIATACSKIERYLKGVDWGSFLDDEEKQDAVIRQIALIGEAAGRLSPDCRERHSGQPWRQMANMRNILVHDYTNISLDRVWQTASVFVPQLATAMPGVIASEEARLSEHEH
jgi:uncharacterized protein with HEPN domain